MTTDTVITKITMAAASMMAWTMTKAKTAATISTKTPPPPMNCYN